MVFIPLTFISSVFSQGVGINDSGAAPSPSAGLDVDFTNKGLLIPRITQAQRNAISSPSASLLIYQTDNTPGYYYNSGTPSSPAWTQLITSASIGWSLTGNASTIAGTNFIGTTDAKDMIFKTNNTESMRILSGGNVGIGITSPTEILHILGRLKMQDTYGKNTIIETISNNVGNGLAKVSAGGTNSINFVVGDGFNDNFKVGTSNNPSYFRDKLKIGDIAFGSTSSQLEVVGTTTLNNILVITPRSSAPTSPTEGMVYYDSTVHKLLVYDGTSWQTCW